MENIIREMIEKAKYYEKNLGFYDEACDLLQFVRDLTNRMEITTNCPLNWRNIREELAEKYKDNIWIMDHLDLWDYIVDED